MMIAAVILATGVRPLQHLKVLDEQRAGRTGRLGGGRNTGVAEGTTHSLTVAGTWVVSPNFVVGQPGPATSTVGSV